MKNILFILLLTVTTCYAQTTDLEIEKNRNGTEVKFNALSISLGALELEFERTLSRRSSIGLSFFNNLIAPDEYLGYNNENSIAAFYRFYFGKRYAQGFFLEAFGMYNTSDMLRQSFFIGNNQRLEGYETVQDFGVGLGLGYKWVSKKGLILQGNFGLGKNLFNADQGEEVVGRVGISVGYRF